MTRRPAAIAILCLLLLSACGRRVAGEAPRDAPREPSAPETGAAPEGYQVREGSALFHHYCAPCHGAEGHGDGLNAYNLDPRPRDLAEPAFQKSRSNDELAAVIRSGGGAAGLSTSMPPWGRTLDERRIRYLVSYLRRLEPSED